MASELKPGDKVEWNSSGGHSVGQVIKKATSSMQIKGHKVAASKDNPEYVVRSDKSGGEAAHKPESLTKSR
jgi:plastocyanin